MMSVQAQTRAGTENERSQSPKSRGVHHAITKTRLDLFGPEEAGAWYLGLSNCSIGRFAHASISLDHEADLEETR